MSVKTYAVINNETKVCLNKILWDSDTDIYNVQEEVFLIQDEDIKIGSKVIQSDTVIS